MTRLVGTYQDYLRSPYWRAIRRRALLAAGRRCEQCQSPYALEVHHLTYERLGCERPEDLQVLCDLCHANVHGHVPELRPVCTGEPDLIGDLLARDLALCTLLEVASHA